MMPKVTKRPKRAPVNAPNTKILPGEMNTSILPPHAGLILGFFNAENWHSIGLVEGADALHGSPGVYFAMHWLGGASSRGHHARITGGFTTSRSSKCRHGGLDHSRTRLAAAKIGRHRTNLIEPGLILCHLFFSGLALF